MVPSVLHEILHGGLSQTGGWRVIMMDYKSTSHASAIRQDVAAACIFLATKTEECGRKLKDVARVFCSKVWGRKIDDIADDSQVRDIVCTLDTWLTFDLGTGRQSDSNLAD